MKQLWQDTVAFRETLPALGDLSAGNVNAQDSAVLQNIADYRQFYALNFPTAHQHHIGVFDSDDYQLVGQIFQPENPKGTLFVYHGYFDHLGLYGFAIQLGLELGLTVVGFDLPGHGLSSGQQGSIECFSRYAKAQQQFVQIIGTIDACPKPWFALGQSTGAAVIMDTLLEKTLYNLDTDFYDGGLIFLAPLIRCANWNWVRVLYQVLRHRGGTIRTFRNNSANETFVAFLRDLDPLQHRRIEALWVGSMIRYAKRIVKAKPVKRSVLVLQGDQDNTVAFKYNMEQLRRLFDSPEIVMLPGARHHLVNEADEYRDVMRREIRRYILDALKR